MKRGAAALEEEAPQIFVWPEFFPDDVLCVVLRWAYRDEVHSKAEMDELWQMRRTSPQFRRVIEDCVVPHIQALDARVLARMYGKTLRRFVGLRELSIFEREPGKAGGELIASLPFLERLTLHRNPDITLEQLTTTAARLTFLALHHFRGKFDLTAMPRLREIVISNSRDDSLVALETPEFLIIEHNDNGRALPSLPRLRRFALCDYAAITGIAEAAPALEALRLGLCTHGRALEADAVAEITTLRALDFRRSNGRYGDALLHAMPKLESLLLGKFGHFMDAGIGGCLGLRSLSLASFRNVMEDITGASVSKLSNLTWLCIAEWQQPLDFSLLGELRVLDLSVRGDVYGADPIGHLSNLHTLILDFCTSVAGATLRALTQLEVLSLVENVVMDGEDLELLVNLRVLNITGNGILAHLEPLPYLPRLEKLYMGGGGRDYRRLLPGLPRLQYLRHARQPHMFGVTDDTAWLRARGVRIEYASGEPFSYPLPDVWYEGASRAFNAEWDALTKEGK